jgi:hypothetical protein
VGEGWGDNGDGEVDGKTTSVQRRLSDCWGSVGGQWGLERWIGLARITAEAMQRDANVTVVCIAEANQGDGEDGLRMKRVLSKESRARTS